MVVLIIFTVLLCSFNITSSSSTWRSSQYSASVSSSFSTYSAHFYLRFLYCHLLLHKLHSWRLDFNDIHSSSSAGYWHGSCMLASHALSVADLTGALKLCLVAGMSILCSGVWLLLLLTEKSTASLPCVVSLAHWSGFEVRIRNC